MEKLNKKQEEEMTEWLESREFDQVFIEKNPSERMDYKFQEMLNKHRKVEKRSPSWIQLLRFALPTMAVVVAFFLGSFYSGQDSEKQHSSVAEKSFASELLSLDKASKKINLVSNTTIQDESDQQIIDALLFTLNNDESVNVRLACINTLYDYAYLPNVRSGLIKAVSNQDSPIVLANLAQAINASGKKLSKEEFMDLINKDLPPPIKNTIDANLIKI